MAKKFLDYDGLAYFFSKIKGLVSSHTEDTSNPHGVTAAQVGAVPTTRKVNNKALSADVTLSAADVGALKTITALSDLGLSGAVTMDQVCAALPYPAQLVLMNNIETTNYISDVPGEYGTIEIVHIAENYCMATWTRSATYRPDQSIGVYHPNTGWGGWFEIYSTYRKPTAEEVGAASEADHKILTYGSLPQLGLSGSVTLDDIFAAMPNGSMLVFNNTTASGTSDYVSDCPTEYGTLIVTKRQTNYCFAQFVPSSETESGIYYNFYHSNAGWSGWTTHFLPLSGGVLTGKSLGFYNGISRVLGDTNRLQLETYNVAGDSANRRVLHLRNSLHTESDVADALALYDVVEGAQTIYKLYGEHNKPAPADIGAAPSGYGLGGEGAWITDLGDNLNGITKCGFYSWTASAANIPFDYGNLVVLDRGGARGTQLAFDPQMSGNGLMAIRHYNAGTFSGWEYINPTMSAGTEYKTIERWNGKTVYTKLINCGAMPNASTKTVSTGVSAEKIIKAKNVILKDGTMIESPYFTSAGALQVKHMFTETNVQFATTVDYSDRTGYVQIWYTKD